MHILKAIQRFIFGYDIFISYSRQDSLDYAYSIASYFMKKNYDCYIDQLSNANPGKKIPKNILSALTKSTAFVVIGSAGSAKSIPIGEEVTTFKNLKSNNPIIPIDINGNIFLTNWYGEIEGLAIIHENESDFTKKQASPAILERINNSLNFTKKSQKLRRAAFAFLAFFILSICATAFMFTQVASAKKELVKTSRQIKQQQMQALIYLSNITAPVNTITALKHALKAFTDYQDVDTANVAEKNLLKLYNDNEIVIQNNFSTGGKLSPNGKYIIVDGQLYSVSTKKEFVFNNRQDVNFSPDDEIIAINTPTEIKLYHLPDTLLLNSFMVKDSIATATFNEGNRFIFISTSANNNSDTVKKRIRIFDRKNYKLIADFKIPVNYYPIDYKNNGGFVLLNNLNELNKGAYIWHIASDSIQQITTNKEEYALINHLLTDDGLILEQTVKVKKIDDLLKSTNYNFRVKLINVDGKILQDSTFVHNNFLKIDTKSIYTSSYNQSLLFGLSAPWGTHFLLNTNIRPFKTPEQLTFGSLLNGYNYFKLISDDYVLAVGLKNDEYTIAVFKLNNPGVKQIFKVVNKNHPDGSIEEDQFMKSINISFSPATNFITIYDRGQGTCKQYYIDKKPIKSAKEFADLISQKKLFLGIWDN